MAKKVLDGFGKTPKVASTLSEFRIRRLAEDDWFIEPTNTDTRNALVQGLELVDHGGDSINYKGDTVHGFKVPFSYVLFMVKSKNNGVYIFTVYHKSHNRKDWRRWQLHMKYPKAIVTSYVRGGKLTCSV